MPCSTHPYCQVNCVHVSSISLHKWTQVGNDLLNYNLFWHKSLNGITCSKYLCIALVPYFKWFHNWNSLWVSRIISRDQFHTSRHANFSIPWLELLHVASFAQILGRNVLYPWFRGIKRNSPCWFQDIKTPTSRLLVKYGIGIYIISREVWNSVLSLHCYCFGWSIRQLREVREVGFRSRWSNSAYPQWTSTPAEKHLMEMSEPLLDINMNMTVACLWL